MNALVRAIFIALLVLPAGLAHAIEAISVQPEQEKVDITAKGELYEGRGDKLQIETAPGPDGYIGRMAVQASTPGTNPGWLVFALSNPTSERIVRWLVAPRYTLADSRVFWPELDAGRVSAVTPSLGFRPEPLKSDRADMFRLNLEPGQTITFAAEMSSAQVPRLTLWDPNAYQSKQQDRMLFNGVLLGITGLLAIFLTAIFAANHRAIFPATALVAWAALAYFCVDFGFWNKLFPVGPDRTALYRAAAEAGLAASLVLFLYAFLRIGLWHVWIRTLFWCWIAAQFGLIFVAIVDPAFASGLARASTLAIAGVGTGLIAYLALRGQDRALALIPSWMLLVVWLFGAAMVVLGKLSGDVVISGLVAGLVLILVLLGFTVTQFAFRSTAGALNLGPPSLVQVKSLAVDGSGAYIFQWHAGKHLITVASEVEKELGLDPGSLTLPVEEFLQHMHNSDRERFRLMLWSLQEKQGGDLQIDFRLRRHDGTYLWYDLRGHATPSDNARLLRFVGLMRDVTSLKRSHERLMHDAVHDSLTGLPNRELFMDRLSGAITRSREGQANRPTVIFIDIDRFKNVNKSFGLVIGDSMLLTLGRRLSRHLNPQDTLARLGGDQFAILLISETDPHHVATLAERVRRALRTPMKISAKEIVLTASIGIVVHDGSQVTGQDMLREGEIAMLRAKRGGADRIEIFNPSMRGEDESRLPLESDLRKALERQQIAVLYQPITRLASNQLAGFEALLRWDHPTRGRLGAEDFIPLAEETGMIVELGSYVLSKALEEAAGWHKVLPRDRDPLFVSVNVSSRQLFRQDMVQEIRLMLAREAVPRGTLKLEITESLVMENPERAVEILTWLKTFGASLALDDFGTGYCSLSYLHRFPCDTIKVDRSLVRDSGLNGSTPLILRSIIALAHELGKEVVAEGVETAADASYLRSIGCEYGQGYYYGEPMAAKDVGSLLAALASHRKRKDRERAREPQTPKGLEVQAPGATILKALPAPGASS
ncbi:MAG TPA: sensor domain-containing phosphodiesterase [Rhizobiales bacterium]|jgi:diguanylate cyclase (GGDEF)-like protein/PAS domain S-box-containing protein|nr:sensor domain-containing phosphodiesterase [Hyphomicrobiales bacterium]HBH41832.1 sensor domain-containing phosphodiesterase [Hyphomicrobiales bacterium]HCL60893.1 sensor domain-containing phosphodiesterase [Hyphomicrobiales bacterium]